MALKLKLKLSQLTWAKPVLSSSDETYDIADSIQTPKDEICSLDESEDQNETAHVAKQESEAGSSNMETNDMETNDCVIVLEKYSQVDSYVKPSVHNKIVLKRVSDGHYVVNNPATDCDTFDKGVNDVAMESNSSDEAPATPSSLAPSSIDFSVDSGFEEQLTDDSQVICPYCPKQLILRLLPAHMKFHSSDCQYICNQCSFSTSYK